jgi:hypothetical protein
MKQQTQENHDKEWGCHKRTEHIAHLNKTTHNNKTYYMSLFDASVAVD